MSLSIPQEHTSAAYAVQKYRNTGGSVIIGKNREYIVSARNGGSTNVPWGNKLQFYFNKISDAIATNVDIRVQMAIPTVTGGSPTAIQYVNCVGIFMFQRIRFLSQSHPICQDVDPQLFRNWLQAIVPIDEWPIVAQQIGLAPSATRQSNISGVQTFYLPVHWLFRYLQQFPLGLIADGQICLELWLQPSATSVVMYTGGTTPVVAANINLMEMRVSCETSAPVAGYIQALSDSGKTVAPYGLNKGLLFEGNDFLTMYYTGNSGDTYEQFQIPQMADKLVKGIIVTSQLASDLSNTAGAIQYDNYTNVISSFNILSGSTFVDGTDSFPITTDMLLRDYARNHVPGVYQLNIGTNTVNTTNALYRIFCNNLDQDSFDEGMPGFDGAYDYFGITNMYLKINLAAALSAATTFTVHVIYARRDVLGKSGLFDELSSLVRKPGY